MPKADIAIRVDLVSKRKRDALKAVRAAAGPPFRLYSVWGLVDDPRKGTSSFVNRLRDTEALWKLAKEKWVSPRMLGFFIQILSEGYARHLLIAAPKRRPTENPHLPVKTQDLDNFIKALRSAAHWLKKPLHPELDYTSSPELAAELELRAKTLEPLHDQLKSFDPPHHERHRPIQAKSMIEGDLIELLGLQVSTKEARRWAARIAADFLNDHAFASGDRAARRKRERERGPTRAKRQ